MKVRTFRADSILRTAVEHLAFVKHWHNPYKYLPVPNRCCVVLVRILIDDVDDYDNFPNLPLEGYCLVKATYTEDGWKYFEREVQEVDDYLVQPEKWLYASELF